MFCEVDVSGLLDEILTSSLRLPYVPRGMMKQFLPETTQED